MRVYHEFGPVFNEKSKVLILGSFPSVKSREDMFYYAHPQNRFWKVISILFNEEIKDKKEFVLRKDIALWDMVASCEITGSADTSIKNIEINDITYILNNSGVKYIFALGKKSYDLYNKYMLDKTKLEAICLSSTSPAYASKTLDDLVKEFTIIKEKLEND